MYLVYDFNFKTGPILITTWQWRFLNDFIWNRACERGGCGKIIAQRSAPLTAPFPLRRPPASAPAPFRSLRFSAGSAPFSRSTHMLWSENVYDLPQCHGTLPSDSCALSSKSDVPRALLTNCQAPDNSGSVIDIVSDVVTADKLMTSILRQICRNAYLGLCHSE